MRRSQLAVVYLLFFLSGAAALVYQVVWVRSLSLVFGGSHLAVTTVLSVFMGGLALGGWLFGRRAERTARPLVLYAVLELGIAAGALLFAGLVTLYPHVYASLAAGRDGAIGILSALRVALAAAALTLPTTLMGGTLPALTAIAGADRDGLGRRLSSLYAWNTLGAVAGAATAGFVLLRFLSVSWTLGIAVGTSLAIGAAALALGRAVPLEGRAAEAAPAADVEPRPEAAGPADARWMSSLALLGTAVSGFCALGYEVLWTRTLSMVVGASVYGFTTMLVAFLGGIAAGSEAYGRVARRIAVRPPGTALRIFGALQLAIAVAALAVTVRLRELPQAAIAVREALGGIGLEPANVRVWGGLLVAFLHMAVPAFFMGAAFPAAGDLHARLRRSTSSAVGRVLTWNTAGSILGSAASGFVLVYAFGAERSLQLLVVANAAVGVAALVAPRSRRLAVAALAGGAAVTLALAANPGVGKLWDTRFFAIFRNNQVDAFRTPEAIHEALENTDVLYWGEGADANISSIRVKGGHQAVVVNGKVVASTHREGLQCQYALGHVPMLLHPKPESVLVVGLGTGMTLGATAVHPSVKELTLVEIEPKVEGAARTFAAWNHSVMDDPRLEIVHNDGRNFLLTTRRTFDVITADPIHPWAQGAAYLYTDEYFGLAASKLRDGGVMCQWLPLYELTPDDLRMVARTFSRHFPYTYVWMTHNDAELVGSNSPIALHAAALDRRLDAAPLAKADLASVDMGSGRDLLAYAVMGGRALGEFGRGAVVNTDDNLRLEFSAPLSAGKFLIPGNVAALYAHQEPVVPGLVPDDAVRLRAAAHVATFEDPGAPRTAALVAALRARYPEYAPGRYLEEERAEWVRAQPAAIAERSYPLRQADGRAGALPLAAVWSPVSDTRGSVMFVDAAKHVVFGERYFDGPGCRDEGARFAGQIVAAVDAAYGRVRGAAPGEPPREDEVLAAIRSEIAASVGPRAGQ